MAPLDQDNALGNDDHSESFLSQGNATYLSEMHAKYLADRNSVDANWQAFFQNFQDADLQALKTEIEGPSWGRKRAKVVGASDDGVTTGSNVGRASASVQASAFDIRQAASDSIGALQLIRAYRVRGHLKSNLDPLGIKDVGHHPELEPASYGFNEADMDRKIFINGVLGMDVASLREILEALKKVYCETIGVEIQHITDPEQKRWLQQRIERVDHWNKTEFTERGKFAIYERLVAAEKFEQFLDKKHKGTKRFGLDGGESMIPALEQILKVGSQMGLEEVVVGMPHRGRLNVLANFMKKPFRAIFSEFAGNSSNPDDVQGSGDVKYHLGTSTDREFDDKTVHLSLTANPSHLEAVNPVVIGKVRAKQEQRNDTDRTKVMAMLMHGDAAFAGQGLVPESLDLSELKGYRIGGTIHFIVNNQIGFTTNPINARSGPYCTEVAKIIEAPIFHVNGDDPEAVVHVARVATEFRQTFKKDVVIDMFCYRRHGHNEGDEPAFTQPLMYQQIKKQKTTATLYAEKLIKDDPSRKSDLDATAQQIEDMLNEEFEASNTYKPNSADWFGGAWQGLTLAQKGPRRGKTAIEKKTYDKLADALTSVPEGFDLNPKLVRLLKQKRQMFDKGEGFDWATAEAMAFGSLLMEKAPIRFTGQDVGRGTFSHRHAVLRDQSNEKDYIPVNNIEADQSQLEIHNSPLSEAAVLGFEHGYASADPNALTIWEAQFGDFANGAQIIIDQFIVSSESKWLRFSGLVMLLPHGYEGQGPEHSSARLERFLQMCGEDNMQVVNCTTPANYYHVLRRQIQRDFRKPLIVMAPKSLLRHKMAVSEKHDFINGSSFHRVLYCNDRPEKSKVKRVVLCSGKVYYDLKEAAIEQKRDDVYFLRLEQLYPFPSIGLREELEGFEKCEFVWCQEEPKNMGAWSSVEPELEEVLFELGAKQGRVGYAGRKAAASPATGSNKKHVQEQAALVEAALSGKIVRGKILEV
ncbi:MAG: 2-oxoglutarate dehydrogenase E1 component [Alphaproteobacteria bacterium]